MMYLKNINVHFIKGYANYDHLKEKLYKRITNYYIITIIIQLPTENLSNLNIKGLGIQLV